MHSLYTIGHSNHSLPHFLGLLACHAIPLLVDVRSQPFSRICPHFNKDRLAAELDGQGLSYIFLGDALGARREEAICYVNGQARYDRIAQLPL